MPALERPHPVDGRQVLVSVSESGNELVKERAEVVAEAASVLGLLARGSGGIGLRIGFRRGFGGSFCGGFRGRLGCSFG